MQSLNPAKPWGTKDLFLGIGYYTHNLESYILKPESLVLPSRPPPAEGSVEDQPFYLVPFVRVFFLNCLSINRSGGSQQEKCSG